MTAEAAGWLPLPAVDDPRLVALLAAAVEQWSGHWFARGGWRLARSALRSAGASLPGSKGAWVTLGPGLAMVLSDDRRAALARAALDAPADAPAPGGSDSTLLDALSAEIVADLARRLTQALRLPAIEDVGDHPVSDPCAAHGGLDVSVDDVGGKQPLRLSIGLSSLVPLRKHLIGSAPRPASSSGRVSDAVAREYLDVRAVLGVATVPLIDMARLSPGDILVLDTGLEDAVSLRTSRSGAAVLAARLSWGENGMEMRASAV